MPLAMSICVFKRNSDGMKIVVDKFIPYINGVLEPFAEVQYLAPADFTPEAVRCADALVVRTRTRCDGALLADSAVKFIATATIGYDHIDTQFCAERGIAWTNAAGCNAAAVAQYVASALGMWAHDGRRDLRQLTLGIVGVGHVGCEVLKTANLLGMSVLQNDPIRANAENSADFVSLDTVAAHADVITFHTPLTHSGRYATYHLADADFFAKCARKPLIINAARGGVVDEQALKQALQCGRVSACVVDCWENEPHIDRELLDLSLLATPHIAGYSVDGKATATAMCVRAVSRFFGLGLDDFCVSQLPPKPICRCTYSALPQKMVENYDIRRDDAALRHQPDAFERLRSGYSFRREVDYLLENQQEA